eukprot:scaffold22516_cov47-Phaeocystis_antarctica.AAC.1
MAPGRKAKDVEHRRRQRRRHLTPSAGRRPLTSSQRTPSTRRSAECVCGRPLASTVGAACCCDGRRAGRATPTLTP